MCPLLGQFRDDQSVTTLALFSGIVGKIDSAFSQVLMRTDVAPER